MPNTKIKKNICFDIVLKIMPSKGPLVYMHGNIFENRLQYIFTPL